MLEALLGRRSYLLIYIYHLFEEVSAIVEELLEYFWIHIVNGVCILIVAQNLVGVFTWKEPKSRQEGI